MASTAAGTVVTAGALTLIEDIVSKKWRNDQALKVAVATVLAAFVSEGVNKVAPGLGTGFAVVLLLGVVLKSGPVIADKILRE